MASPPITTMLNIVWYYGYDNDDACDDTDEEDDNDDDASAGGGNVARGGGDNGENRIHLDSRVTRDWRNSVRLLNALCCPTLSHVG